jgi:hypothetical protein
MLPACFSSLLARLHLIFIVVNAAIVDGLASDESFLEYCQNRPVYSKSFESNIRLLGGGVVRSTQQSIYLSESRR